MKKLVLLIAVAGMVTCTMLSCGGGKQEESAKDGEYGEYETADQGATKKAEPATPEELIAQGKTLSEQSDCKTCHHQTNKLIGPAHMEVAEKYEFTRENVVYLGDKIKNGGSGVWGQIPMTPHADLSVEDAEKMAMYVLSLDGEEPKL